MKSKSLFLYMARTARRADARGGIAGSKTSRVARVVVMFRIRMGGAKFVSMSFVHAARKPEIGSFIRTGDMTGRDVLFKASAAPYSCEMMNKVVAGGLFPPDGQGKRDRGMSCRKSSSEPN